jgi:D-sedoheptulose 7-phosphate isomerase
MNIKKFSKDYFEKLKEVIDKIEPEKIQKIVEVLFGAYKNNKQIFIMGNGGSAATASHFACDLGNQKVRRVISLADNIARMTALSNDLSYEEIFSQQLSCLVDKGDVVVAFSGSGNSANIIKALNYAKDCGAITIGFLGFETGGKAKELVDYDITVQDRHYGRIEDVHLILEHLITNSLAELKREEENKVVFLDRDGVINKATKKGDYVKSWEEFEFLPGSIEAVKMLNDKGYRVYIITNQSGIGRGMMKEEDLNLIHDKMLQEMSGQGAVISKIYYCPHENSENCDCKKPKPGMLIKAAEENGIDLKEAFFIGDGEKDFEAGKAAGCKTILLNNKSLLDIVKEI